LGLRTVLKIRKKRGLGYRSGFYKERGNLKGVTQQ